MLTERKLWELISEYRSVSNVDRINGKFLTADNLTRCINLFDNITEFLGIFKEIMHEIKNDFIEAIYSRTITASESENCDFVERIPYFILYKNSVELQKINTLKLENLNESLLKEVLQQSEHVKILRKINLIKEVECQEYKTQAMEYQNKISLFEKELENLRSDKLQTVKEMNDKIEKLNTDNDKLQEKLHQQKLVRNELQVYKEAHEHLDKTFMESCQEYQNEKEQETGTPFNKKANLELEIKTITTMDSDIRVLENLLLDDFDKRIMDFKTQIMKYKFLDGDIFDINSTMDRDIDHLIAKAIMNFNKSKLYFQNEFSQVLIESLTLQNHQAVLINDWSVIHEAELEQESIVIKDIKASFTFDERIMNKYSIMIYFSNDGETFYESKATQFCESCGNKSAFCPHDIHQKETILKLPSGSTHVKIQRPEMKINSKYAKYFISNPNRALEEKLEAISNEGSKQSSRKTFRSSQSGNDSEMIPFNSLLEDFEMRTKIERISPRKFNEIQILSTMEDFWATILNEDEYDSQSSEITTLLDKLYLFFLDRYGHEKAAMLSLYDFLVSIIELAESSRLIQLFCHVLIGNIDSSVMRYLFLMVDCLELIEWKNEDVLRKFLSIVHPFFSEDDIDGVVLSYISFTENVYNKNNMLEFLLYNFLKERDPRFDWVISEASNLKTNTPGFYTFTEFQILLDSLTSLPNKKLSIRLFKELAIDYTQEGSIEYAPSTKIAEIVAFLSFLESEEIIKQSLREMCQDESRKQKEPLRWSYCRLMSLASVLLREN